MIFLKSGSCSSSQADPKNEHSLSVEISNSSFSCALFSSQAELKKAEQSFLTMIFDFWAQCGASRSNCEVHSGTEKTFFFPEFFSESRIISLICWPC